MQESDKSCAGHSNWLFFNKLQNAFNQPKGDLLQQSIDEMPNELYQRLLLLDGSIIREHLPIYTSHPKDLKKFIEQWNDQDLKTLPDKFLDRHRIDLG